MYHHRIWHFPVIGVKRSKIWGVGGVGGEGNLHFSEERGDEKRKGEKEGELIHLSALCFLIVIFCFWTLTNALLG